MMATIHIRASKNFIQFGACNLNEHLVESLVLMNPNEFNVKFIVNLITLNEQQFKSDDNMFFFYQEDSTKPLSIKNIIEFKPKQQVILTIKFQPHRIASESSSICHGVVKISSINSQFNFQVQIIGFIGKANLIVNDILKQTNINCLNTIKYSMINSILNCEQKFKQVLSPDLQSEWESYFSGQLNLKNESNTSKCFLNLIPINKTFNKTTSLLKMNINENFIILNENQAFNLIYDFKTSDQTVNLIENNKIHLNLLLLWIEYDIFLYFYQLLQQNLQVKMEIFDDMGDFDLDKYIYANILSKNYDFLMNDNKNQQNSSINSNVPSSAVAASLPSLNLTNESIYLHLINKGKLSKDDLIEIFKSFLNYSIVTLVFDLDTNKQQQPNIILKKVNPLNDQNDCQFKIESSNNFNGTDDIMDYNGNYSMNTAFIQSTLNKTNDENNEQDALLSEITQNSLDRVSITPLINVQYDQQQQQNKSIAKIVRFDKDAQIIFPNVSVGSSSNTELVLNNPTNNYVRWESFSNGRAFIDVSDSNNESISSIIEPGLQIKTTPSTLIKSKYNIFFIKPDFGLIPPSQKQIIKIEFHPREFYGLFTQHWEIKTVSFDLDKKINDSCNCKLVLNGYAIENIMQNQSFQQTIETRILVNKQNLLDNKTNSVQQQATNNKQSKNFNKENIISSSNKKDKIHIKQEIIEFPSIKPGEISQITLDINNVEDRVCTLQVMKLLDPFNCKYTEVIVKPKHYIRIPIEFKPISSGDYIYKIFVKVDGNGDVPLSCILKAKTLGC